MYKISQYWYVILVILAAIYFYFYVYKYKQNKENFTPSLRPHLRNMRLKYEHFMNKSWIHNT